MITKAGLREEIRRQRAAWSAEWIEDNSIRISDALAQLPEIKAARTLGCYLAMPREVQTRAFIQRCWRAGLPVCVPAARDGVYALARLAPDTRMTVGRMRIEEPAVPEWWADEPLDVIVVPGVAFDIQGGRLGHGAGFYDRILSDTAARNAFKVGVAFDFQVFERVPMDGHDIAMNAVVTERRSIRPGMAA